MHFLLESHPPLHRVLLHILHARRRQHSVKLASPPSCRMLQGYAVAHSALTRTSYYLQIAKASNGGRAMVMVSIRRTPHRTKAMAFRVIPKTLMVNSAALTV